MSTHSLAHTLTEDELQDWRRYAAHRMLPQRRIELLLAQIAQLIAAYCGRVPNTRLQDYLFDPVPAASTVSTALSGSTEELHAFFEFKPRRKTPPKE
jgi:hypothetical protein